MRPDIKITGVKNTEEKGKGSHQRNNLRFFLKLKTLNFETEKIFKKTGIKKSSYKFDRKRKHTHPIGQTYLKDQAADLHLPYSSHHLHKTIKQIN